MDHVLEAMRGHIDAYLYIFQMQWRSGQYKKYSDCPAYADLKAINDAMNIIRKRLGWDTKTFKELVSE